MDITDELMIAAKYEKHGGRAHLMVQASKEIARLRRVAGFVCELDWSDELMIAAQRIDNLRKAIADVVVAS